MEGIEDVNETMLQNDQKTYGRLKHAGANKPIACIILLLDRKVSGMNVTITFHIPKSWSGPPDEPKDEPEDPKDPLELEREDPQDKKTMLPEKKTLKQQQPAADEYPDNKEIILFKDSSQNTVQQRVFPVEGAKLVTVQLLIHIPRSCSTSEDSFSRHSSAETVSIPFVSLLLGAPFRSPSRLQPNLREYFLCAFLSKGSLLDCLNRTEIAFKALPKYLFIDLTRVDLTNPHVKSDERIEFPFGTQLLSLSTERQLHNYVLTAVILHCGRSNDGAHYQLLQRVSVGRWMCMSDETISEIEEKTIPDRCFGGTNDFSNAKYLLSTKMSRRSQSTNHKTIERETYRFFEGSLTLVRIGPSSTKGKVTEDGNPARNEPDPTPHTSWPDDSTLIPAPSQAHPHFPPSSHLSPAQMDYHNEQRNNPQLNNPTYQQTRIRTSQVRPVRSLLEWRQTT
ncbi:hypothetical protein BLNAU_22749 [Blattamonas nauphoetae]|uniref:USP domain-containing protein n=1 Tax=Blattamonas nauphoetae TaxID=2049346 RepID=A0ABQ9WT87_9EUKA|nr:hypothetical protein BLNAU_22749 [Blattamonas nauphoetae]